ncbi:NAD(P)/FAD-dependent oxidoreductase [Nocardioides aestuarii]|uniref:Flavin-containing monooxygenase n=1 Tax=Nocardioides aestuarii TaxID=252231 RepID=A0ABW4TSE9_9ACTN
MRSVTTVVIGAGHSGLAMSRRLTERSIDHVVIERGDVANSWSTQRWDSLRLLTPGWMTRLPGWAYDGERTHGYQGAAEVAALLSTYATRMAAPLVTGTAVTSVRPSEPGFVVDTERGPWHARTVVLACGPTLPSVPGHAAHVPHRVHSLPALAYRNPAQLPEGGALVVGASASGVQIADELHRSGRPVTLAVGEHVRMPRHYRGHDIFVWLEALGILDQRWDQVDDLVRLRALPSPQLGGSGRSLDVASLIRRGIRAVGKVVSLREGTVQFSGSLTNTLALADLKLSRLLDAIDDRIGGRGERFEPTATPAGPLELDLRSGEIATVVWATGVQPDHSWLGVPVLDRRGRLRHDGGVVPWPGLYVLGLPTLRTRRSTYIDGSNADTRDLADHLVAHLAGHSFPPTMQRIL